MDAPPQLITAGQVAKLLNVHRSTVKRRAEAGTIPVAQRVEGSRGPWLFDATVIQALVLSETADVAA